MTGPQHYAEAERLLAEVAESDAETAAPAHAAAQIHATLALAASFAEVNPTSAWHEVAS